MFGRAVGVLCGTVGSAGAAGPAWLVTEVDRVGGATSGEGGSSGATKPVFLVASATGDSSCTTRDIAGAVEPDRMSPRFPRGECPQPVVDWMRFVVYSDVGVTMVKARGGTSSGDKECYSRPTQVFKKFRPVQENRNPSV